MASATDPKTLWERLGEDQSPTSWVESGESRIICGSTVRLKDGSNWVVQRIVIAPQRIRMTIGGVEKEEHVIISKSEVTLVSADDTVALKKMPIEVLEAELMNVPTLWERLGDVGD